MKVLNKWPEQYYKALCPTGINDALKSITPELSLYRKEFGEIKLYAIITLFITDLLDFFSVGKTMGLAQIAETARFIYEDFYYFNIEDFKLCFNNAKRGKYGKVYDRIDGNIIYEWLQKYSEERVQTAYPESSYRPEVASKDERISNKRDTEFENFRISYIAEKSLRK